MKNKFLILFLSISFVGFSQKKVIKKFQTTANEIEISTIGLDDFVLENADSNSIEIFLYAENSNKQHITFEERQHLAEIKFGIPMFKTEETVFRKFITKRLQRASAIVKIPKGKRVIVFGDNINIESKNYQGSLAIFIEKGNVKLNTIQETTQVNLYSGNVYASLKNINVDVVSTIGKIKIDSILKEKIYKKKDDTFKNTFTVHTIKATIILTSLKKQ
ncbi:MAG: hypothetical protein ACPGTO_09060 [Polaribacter sp.]